MRIAKPIILSTFFLSFFILFCSILSASENRIICSGHPDYPPFMWQHENTIVGAGSELIRMVFNELGKDFVIEYSGPWARAQEMAQRNKIDFLVGAYSNAHRRTYMDYLVPYAKDPTSIFVLKKNKFVFNHRDDLIGKKGITMFGDSFGDDLDIFIKEKLKVLRVYDSKSLFKQLSSGRVDYILWGDYPCQINAVMKGFDNQIDKAVPPLVFENMHITVSKKSSHAALLPAMNKIIVQLKNNGSIQKMLDKYMDLYIKLNTDAGAIGDVDVFIAKTLSHKRQLVSQISKRSQLKSSIKLLAADQNIFSVLSQRNTLVYTCKNLVPDYNETRWISINDSEGFVFNKKIDKGVIALLRLSYESMMNDGTIKIETKIKK